MDRFHAALPVSVNRILVSGGCSAIGALQDVHIFNTGEFLPLTSDYIYYMIIRFVFHRYMNVLWLILHHKSAVVYSKSACIDFSSDTNMWSSLASPLLCNKPRAGHSMINLGCFTQTDAEKRKQGENVRVLCTVLVFGGSDCSGTFYNDTVKCTVDIPGNKWWVHQGKNPNGTLSFLFFKTMDAVICPDNVTERLLSLCMYVCMSKLDLYFSLDFLYVLNNFAWCILHLKTLLGTFYIYFNNYPYFLHTGNMLQAERFYTLHNKSLICMFYTLCPCLCPHMSVYLWG